MRLLWGPMASAQLPAGYGTVAREMYKALDEIGADLAQPTDFDYDVAVLTGLPVSWALGKALRPDVIWHTMIEVEPMPPHWASVINRAGGCWVPSTWVYQTFRAGGVQVPMMTSGYGIDTSAFQPAQDRAERDGPFKVLVWGRGLLSRKNLTMALRAYVAANLPGAVLEIKVNTDDVLARDGMGVLGRDDVTVIARDWTISQVARWLQSGDVLLYLSSGEGFGLMPLEAMATGLPVVCAANTGMLDYLSEEVAYPVSCRLAPVGTYEQFFGYKAMGFEPIFEAAVAQLRAVYDDRGRALEVGRRAAAKAAGFTWKRAAQQALLNIEQLIGG